MKALALTIILILVLSACQPVLSATNAPPTQLPSATNSPVPLPTPTTTVTPIQTGLEFLFTTDVTEKESVKIATSIKGITTSNLILYRLASPSPEAIPPISTMIVTDENGDPLEYSVVNWNGTADRHLEIVKIITGENKSITLNYTLDLSSQRYWQLTKDYIAVTENMLFFQPDPNKDQVLSMTFQFLVPDGWKIGTRLSRKGNQYTLNPSNTYMVVTNKTWERYYFGAPLLLGDIELIENFVGKVKVVAAFPKTASNYRQDAEFVDDIFRYQFEMLGDPVEQIDDYAIIYVFGPSIQGTGKIIDAIVTLGFFEVDHTKDNRHLGHELFHMWHGCGNVYPERFKFLGDPCWFMEGVNEYLSVESHLAVGAFSAEEAESWHQQFYREYKSIAGTSNDLPVMNCLDSLPRQSKEWLYCHYSKSQMVIYLLDQTIRKYSGEQLTFADVFHELYRAYGNEWSGPILEQDIMITVSNLTNVDYFPFFDAYIFGNAILPIDIIDGKLMVLWDSMVDLSP